MHVNGNSDERDPSAGNSERAVSADALQAPRGFWRDLFRAEQLPNGYKLGPQSAHPIEVKKTPFKNIYTINLVFDGSDFDDKQTEMIDKQLNASKQQMNSEAVEIDENMENEENAEAVENPESAVLKGRANPPLQTWFAPHPVHSF